MYSSNVVGTDGSETAGEAVRQATELAKAVGAHIHLVSAYEPVPDIRLRRSTATPPRRCSGRSAPARTSRRRSARRRRRCRRKGVTVETYPREGDAADAILDVAEEQNAGLVVVGNRGMTGARRFLLGSVPNKISHHAPCSVLIIRTT